MTIQIIFFKSHPKPIVNISSFNTSPSFHYNYVSSRKRINMRLNNFNLIKRQTLLSGFMSTFFQKNATTKQSHQIYQFQFQEYVAKVRFKCQRCREVKKFAKHCPSDLFFLDF